MINEETVLGALAFTAFYFFIAGLVAENSCAEKYRHISSPLPSFLRGVAWPLVVLKFVMLAIWSGL